MSIRPSITSQRSPFSIQEWPIAMKAAGALVGMIIVVSVLLIVVGGERYRQALVNRELEALELTSRVKALQIVSALTRDSEILEQFANTNEVETAIGEQSLNKDTVIFDSLRGDIPEIAAAALISKSGKVVTFFAASPKASSPDSSQWAWFNSIETMPLDTILIGGGPDAGLKGIRGVNFGLPVDDSSSDKIAGVLYVVVDPKRYGAGSRITDTQLFLADGTPIGNWSELADDSIAEILNSESGSMMSDTNGPPLAFGYVHLDNLAVDYLPAGQLNWTITIQQRYQTILGNIQSEIAYFNLLVAVSALLLSLGVVGVCYWFYFPVRKLTAVADQIASTDNLDLALPKDPASDLVILANGFQSLLDRLKYRSTQLQTAAVVSRESITQDIETLLNRIAGILYKHLGLSAVYFYHMEPGGLRAYVEAAQGNPQVLTHKPGNAIILTNKSLLGAAFESNELRWEKGLVSAFPGAKDQPAEVVIPFHGDALRALHIVGAPEAFGQFEVNIFRLIASEIGATLENHSLLATVEAARHEADRANQIKSHFLASVSHELRTPLNSIINFSRFVQRGVMGPTNDEQNEALDKVLNSARHLLNLINDVLDISKIEADALELFVEQGINLQEILTRSMGIAQNLLGEKSVALHLETDEELPAITADAQRILQIVLNLLSNACKFTEQGSITVSAHRHDDEILLAVKDSGPGIAPDEHEAVFETFRQTAAGIRLGGGTGLGMPISRRLAEAHGGRLWLESELGKGTTFFVALPIQSPLLASVSN